jgi:putative nucleotidyltransferase with HDIG domain
MVSAGMREGRPLSIFDDVSPILVERSMPVDIFLDRVKDLPVMPEVAAKVMNLKEGGKEISFKELEGIIKVDPGLTSKVLKIANSALYARQREITSLQMAITLLGFNNIRNLVLLLTASSMFPRMRKSAFHAGFWRHCILSGFLARGLAIRCQKGAGAEEAFIAGLLHDIGQAVLYNGDPESYEQALKAERMGAMTLETIEEQMFGVNHRQLGGALLRRWNFPELYADAAAEHESPNINSPHKSAIITMSVACLFAEKIADNGLSPLKADILSQFLPYTCLAGMEIDALAKGYSEELARDPLYLEYQKLFGVS